MQTDGRLERFKLLAIANQPRAVAARCMAQECLPLALDNSPAMVQSELK